MDRNAGPNGAPSAATVTADRRRQWAVGTLAAALLILAGFAAYLVIAVFEGDLPEAFGAGVVAVAHVLRRFGQFAAFVLLYLEESGVPMPMPGDVFVMYVGHRNAAHLSHLVVAWFGLIGVVVLGASNLYFIARRFGRAAMERHLSRMAHLSPSRLEAAERWFRRWGIWTLIVGRHIPGLRVPLTLAAGTFRVPYPMFAASVAISTAIWAGLFMAVGVAFGGRVGHLLQLHREGYVIVPLILAVGFLLYLTLLIRRAGGMKPRA